jgi:hypothetical protein
MGGDADAAVECAGIQRNICVLDIDIRAIIALWDCYVQWCLASTVITTRRCTRSWNASGAGARPREICIRIKYWIVRASWAGGSRAGVPIWGRADIRAPAN